MLHLFVTNAICEVERNHSMGKESIGGYIWIRYFSVSFFVSAYSIYTDANLLLSEWEELSRWNEMEKKELKMWYAKSF